MKKMSIPPGEVKRVKQLKNKGIRREKNRKSRKEGGSRAGMKPEAPPMPSAAVESLRSGVGYS